MKMLTNLTSDRKTEVGMSGSQVFPEEAVFHLLPDLLRVRISTIVSSHSDELPDCMKRRKPRCFSAKTRNESNYTVKRCTSYQICSQGEYYYVVEINLNRYLRQLLTSEYDYDDRSCPAAGNDNFIRRSLIQPSLCSQLLRLGLEELASIVKTEQETFRNDILAITEKEIPIESIRSNLFYLELAWDVEKPTVIPLIDGFKDSFFRHFCDFAEEQQSLKMGRKGRRKGDGYLANNHSFLKAHPVEGEIYKIYTKAVDVIRFEATIEGRRLKQFLDPNLDLTNPSAVENQFKVLAPKYYRHITQIQQWASSVCEIPSILDIFLCRCHPSTAKRMKELIQQLVINGFVHNQGSRYTRELQKLKKLGFIEYFKKGRWRLKPEAKSAFRPLRDMLMGDYAGIKPEGDIRGG